MAINDGGQNSSQTDIVVPELVNFTKIAHHKAYSRISPLKPELSANGKNVVVTGGGTGIGKAIALAFAQAGAQSVSILGRREDRLKSTVDELRNSASSKSSVSQYEVCDLRHAEEVRAAFDSIVKTVGKIDILVSNAAVLPDITPLAGFNTDRFMQGFELNVLTALNAVQAFLPRSVPKPMVINISSCIAHMSAMPMVSGYAVSKAANLKLMDYFAAENPELHVVNVQPGTVKTEMSEKAGAPGKDSGK